MKMQNIKDNLKILGNFQDLKQNFYIYIGQKRRIQEFFEKGGGGGLNLKIAKCLTPKPAPPEYAPAGQQCKIQDFPLKNYAVGHPSHKISLSKKYTTKTSSMETIS